MRRAFGFLIGAAALAACCSACSSVPDASSPAAAGSSSPVPAMSASAGSPSGPASGPASASAAAPGSGSAPAGSGAAGSGSPETAFPVAVSASLSSPQQASSILVPSSCTLQGGVLTATGQFAGGFVPETYIRYGDVVELYAFAAPAGGAQVQVASLGAEKPYPMSGSGPWTVTVPADTSLGTPARCSVAVQSTHAFMSAGNAGG